MSKMGEPSLREVRNMIKHISEDVSSIKGQLSEIIGQLDPDRQHDFSPDDGDHRWEELNKGILGIYLIVIQPLNIMMRKKVERF